MDPAKTKTFEIAELLFVWDRVVQSGYKLDIYSVVLPSAASPIAGYFYISIVILVRFGSLCWESLEVSTNEILKLDLNWIFTITLLQKKTRK